MSAEKIAVVVMHHGGDFIVQERPKPLKGKVFSFPGGLYDEERGDNSIVDTAIREMNEELNFNFTHQQIGNPKLTHADGQLGFVFEMRLPIVAEATEKREFLAKNPERDGRFLLWSRDDLLDGIAQELMLPISHKYALENLL